MTERNHWLGHGFVTSVRRFPERPAIEIDGEATTYRRLYRLAAALARSMRNRAMNEPPLTAVFAYRSMTSYAGVLAALLRGHGYVPLNPYFPPARTRRMLELSGCRTIIVDALAAAQLDEVLRGIDEPLTLVFPERGDIGDLAARYPRHVVLAPRDDGGDEFDPTIPEPTAIAYLLFTSGSTGEPKGVMISHANVTRVLRVMQERYRLHETDRLSQTFDMVFDLSVFDMFMAWQRGACVCVPSRRQMLLPADFITESKLTVWFSVPSLAVLMKRLGCLPRGAFPGLRLSLFCGEALTAEVAHAWQDAAPNSVLDNLYGPTEATVACTVYRWQKDIADAQCENGIVPIGHPLPGMTAIVVNEALEEVVPGQAGELLVSGPQVGLGYWKDPARTAQSFVKLPGRGGLFYRTGDLVRRAGSSGSLVYLGRLDHQIKIRGLRVELGEIEAALRDAAGVDGAVAVGWPVTAQGAESVVAFLESSSVDIEAVLRALKARLPAYMVPRAVHLVEEFPLNGNGKVDRNTLVQLIQREEAATRHPAL